MGIDAVIVLLFVILCLFIGIVLRVFFKDSFIPYTVALFVTGMIIGFITRVNANNVADTLEETFISVGNISPDFILYIFLPILIFEASMNMDIHIFRNTFINASILAVPGLIFSLILTGGMMMLIQNLIPGYGFEWTWTIAFMFGALISATDPIAVVALLNDLKIKKNFATLVDGESMLNDGTSIVFFMLFFSSFTGAAIHHGALVNFLITVLSAIIIGFLFSLVSLWATKRTHNDAKVQNSILIIAAYILFFLTNRIMEVSGIIALVTFGLMISYFGPITLKPTSNKFIKDFWELAAYIANTIIFIIVGIMVAIKCDFSLSNIGLLLIVYIGIYIIRTAMIFLFRPIMKRQKYGLSVSQSVVLSWGGLRGALGLTLALLVAYTPSIPSSVREQVLFFTGGIVALSLIVNATTTKFLLKKLKLTTKPISKVILEYKIMEIYKHKVTYAYNKLKKDHELIGVNWNFVSQYLPHIGNKPKVGNISEISLIAQLRKKIIRRSISKATSLFEDGGISPSSYKRLSFMFENLDDNDGNTPFTDYSFYFESLSKIKPYQKKLMEMSLKFSDYFRQRIINRCDFLNGFILIQDDSKTLVNYFSTTPEFSANNFANTKHVENEIKSTINAARNTLEMIAVNFPIAYQQSINQKAKRILLTKERYIIREMTVKGIFSPRQESDILEEIDTRSFKKIKE